MAQVYYEYIILHHPAVSQREREDGVKKPSQVIKELNYMLAEDSKTVGLRAAREIPTEFIENLEEVEIIIRPFAQ